MATTAKNGFDWPKQRSVNTAEPRRRRAQFDNRATKEKKGGTRGGPQIPEQVLSMGKGQQGKEEKTPKKKSPTNVHKIAHNTRAIQIFAGLT